MLHTLTKPKRQSSTHFHLSHQVIAYVCHHLGLVTRDDPERGGREELQRNDFAYVFLSSATLISIPTFTLAHTHSSIVLIYLFQPGICWLLVPQPFASGGGSGHVLTLGHNPQPVMVLLIKGIHYIHVFNCLSFFLFLACRPCCCCCCIPCLLIALKILLLSPRRGFVVS